MPRKVEISHKTIIFTVAFLASLWLLYYVRDIIMQLFVALLITIILNPLVRKLAQYRIPRPLSILVLYVLIIGLIAFVVSGLVPPLVEQTSAFAQSLPRYLKNVQTPFGPADEFGNQISSELAGLPSKFLKFTISLFSNILAVITVLIVAFYLLISRDQLDSQLKSFFGDKRANEIEDIINKLELKLGGWARGQLILMFAVGLTTYVGLLILGIPFALALGILAGLLEIVPVIGPLIAAVPAVIVGFGISQWTGIATVALAFLIQQLENYILVPNVMKKSVGLNPVVTLVALIIGFKLAGVTGAVLSVPIVITLQTILRSIVIEK